MVVQRTNGQLWRVHLLGMPCESKLSWELVEIVWSGKREQFRHVQRVPRVLQRHEESVRYSQFVSPLQLAWFTGEPQCIQGTALTDANGNFIICGGEEVWLCDVRWVAIRCAVWLQVVSSASLLSLWWYDVWMLSHTRSVTPISHFTLIPRLDGC